MRGKTGLLWIAGLAMVGLSLCGLWTVRAAEQAAAAQQTTIVVDGSTTVGPVAKAFAEYYMQQHPDVKISVSESGSGNGAKSLLNGTCDVADMSRFMTPAEFRAAVETGIYPVAQAIAMDGIAIIVHPSNPVHGLTVAQVRDVYTGKIANWKQLGGPDLPIVLISRDTNSGTYETFETQVLKGDKIGGGAEYVGSNGAVHARVESTPAAAGYVGIGFVDEKVKALPIEGITPDAGTIASGRYPISRPLFMWTNGYPKLGSHVFSFVTLYLTPQGQEIVKKAGFVPVTNYR